MDIKNLKNIEIRNNYDAESLSTLIAKCHAGNTILFFGAGFSAGSRNKTCDPLPLAKDLSVEICKLGGFEEDDDLAYSADYYLKHNDSTELIGLLKNKFHIGEVSQYHKCIAKVN